MNQSGDAIKLLVISLLHLLMMQQKLKLYGGFFSLGIDPASSEIYLGDAIDHRQNGIVYRYLSSGKLIDQFKVGISPGDFAFKPE